METAILDFTHEKNCLIIVDMINGFVFEGALSDRSIEACTSPILALIEQFTKVAQPMIAFCDSHTESCKEFDSFPTHCVAGSHESELIEAIQAHQEKMTVLLKNSTNGFVQPLFLDTFKQYLPLDKVIITGCCTDICVLQFALSLKGYINEHNLTTEIIIPANAVQTFDAPNHNQKEFNEMAFTLMRNAGIQIIDKI